MNLLLPLLSLGESSMLVQPSASDPADASSLPNVQLQTISRAADGFLEHCRVAKGLSANTLRAYLQDLSDFRKYVGGSTVVTTIGRDAVRSYAAELLQGRKLKETTIRRRLASLKVLFRWLEHEEIVPLSVFHRLDLSIRLPKRLPRALSTDEVRGLMRHTERALRARSAAARYTAQLLHFVVVTLFATGLRISELAGVRLEDVDSRDGTIQVRGKGNRERRVYMPGTQAMAVLKTFLTARAKIRSDSSDLLVRHDGRPIHSAWLRLRLRSAAKLAGVRRPVTPHMLRHTAATQLLEAGVDIRLVQRLLGHASIATTQIYTQVTDVALRRRLALANTLGRVQQGGNQ